MADNQFDELKGKYQSVLSLMQTERVRIENLNMQGDKLFIRGIAPSQDVKNRVWDQIKLVDPNYSDCRHSGPGSRGSRRRSVTGKRSAKVHSTARRRPVKNQQAILRGRQPVHEDFRRQQGQVIRSGQNQGGHRT